MSAIFYESAFAEIKDKMKSTLPGRFCLDAYAAIARLSFLLRFAAWLLLFVGIIADFLLLAASPVIMVCMSQPGFDINHPGGIYTLALSTLTYGADLLVPAGLFMVLDKFWQKKPYWGVGLGVFWLILTILTFRAFAGPMHVAQFSPNELYQLLYYRTIDSLIYSSLSLVSVRFTMSKKEEPKLSPVQENSIMNLEKKVSDLTTIIHNQQTINYQKIASELMPLLPRESGIKPEQITALEDRLLCQFEEQITHVISLINAAQLKPEIEEEKEEEFIPEKEPENNTGNLDQNTPQNKPEKEEENNAPIPEKKGEELTTIWDEVIAKFPGVIEWQSASLRSVSIEQIMKATGYTKHKIGRAELAGVKGGNKQIKSVLIWLKKEPAITRKKEPAILDGITPGIEDKKEEELTPVIDAQIETELPQELNEKNTDELDNIPSSNSSRITRQLSIPDEWEKEKNTDPEIVAIEVEKGATNHE